MENEHKKYSNKVLMSIFLKRNVGLFLFRIAFSEITILAIIKSKLCLLMAFLVIPVCFKYSACNNPYISTPFSVNGIILKYFCAVSYI